MGPTQSSARNRVTDPQKFVESQLESIDEDKTSVSDLSKKTFSSSYPVNLAFLERKFLGVISGTRDWIIERVNGSFIYFRASFGNVEAQIEMGNHFEHRFYLNKGLEDFTAALYWFESARKQGSDEAKLKLHKLCQPFRDLIPDKVSQPFIDVQSQCPFLLSGHVDVQIPLEEGMRLPSEWMKRLYGEEQLDKEARDEKPDCVEKTGGSCTVKVQIF